MRLDVPRTAHRSRSVTVAERLKFSELGKKGPKAQTDEHRARNLERMNAKRMDLPVGVKASWWRPRWKAALTAAQEKVEIMEQKGYLGAVSDGAADEINALRREGAKLALTTAIACLDPNVKEKLPARDRLAAARLVLDFSLAKPVAESKVTVQRAEDFLDSVLLEGSAEEVIEDQDNDEDEDDALLVEHRR